MDQEKLQPSPSFLDEMELHGQEIEMTSEGKKTTECLYGEVNGHRVVVWERQTVYAKDADGRPTQEVQSRSERRNSYNEKGQLVREEGRHSLRPHDWEKAYEYGSDGRIASVANSITKGEKAGERNTETFARRADGDLIEEHTLNTGRKRSGENWEEFTVLKVNIQKGAGNPWGAQMEAGNPGSLMVWGMRPEGYEGPDVGELLEGKPETFLTF